ncbi:MAG TPA: sulfatase-like hydrolase/transferase [Nocardioides sp.]|nr:sulfatase-like hydrolase/transferase [Nocardioides sp.]
MGKRLPAALVAALSVALVWLGAGTSTGTHQSDDTASALPEQLRQPNVVLVLTDDMRADDLRYLPKVNRLLVDQGVRFSNAISPHPLCCPARAGLFTGQYAQNSGVQHNAGAWGGAQALLDRDSNIGAWLTTAGYQTAYHGKFLNGWEEERWTPAGWTRWDPLVSGIHSYKRGEFLDGDTYEGEYVAGVMSERSERTIGQLSRSGAPFLSIINHVAPHVTVVGDNLPDSERKYRRHYRDAKPPWLGTRAFDERHVRDLPDDLRFRHVRRGTTIELFRARLRALRSVDDAVASLVRRLDRLGELDETYIVFTSDNGLGMGEHRADRKNILFDETLDVPLVVRGPGVPRGRTVHDLVSLVDLPATFVDWAGAEPGRPLDGASLAGVLRGRGLDRDTLLVQTGDERVNSTPGWNYRGVTTDRFLYGRKIDQPGVGILFDRLRDPLALVNRYGDPDYRRVQRELERRTDLLEECSGELLCNRQFGRVPPPRQAVLRRTR